MKVKYKKFPVIVQIGSAKYLRYFEEVELQESTFKRVCKLLKKAYFIINLVCILLEISLSFFTKKKYSFGVCYLFIGVFITNIINQFKEEFKK